MNPAPAPRNPSRTRPGPRRATRPSDAGSDVARDEVLWDLLDRLPGFVALVSPRFRYLRVNAAYADFARRPADQIVGRTVREVLGATAWSVIRPRATRAVAGRTVRFRASFVSPSGPRTFAATLRPVRRGGKVVAYFVLGDDRSDLRAADTARIEAQHRLDLVLKGSGVVLFTQDRRLRYTWASNAHWGSDESVVGRTDTELIGHSSQVRSLVRLKRGVLRSGQPVRQEVRFDRPDGQEIYDLWLDPRRDESGRVIGLAGVAVDRTQQRTLEDDISVMQSFLSGLVEAMPAPVYVNDREGRMLLVNRAWEQVVGLPRARGIGRALTDLFPPRLAERYRREIREVIRSGRPISTDDRAEFGGRPVRFHTIKIPVAGPDQRIGAVGGISFDVTELTRTRDELAASRERLALVVERLPVALIIWNLDRTAREWNPAATEMFGYTPEEAATLDFLAIVPDHARQAVLSRWRKLVNGSSGERGLNHNLRKDGRIIACEWFNTPLRDQQGRVVAVASMVRDITSEHEARTELDRYRSHLEELVRERTAQLEASSERLRQAERLAAIGTLAAGLGHDMNSLLLPMRLAAESIFAGQEGPPELGTLRRSMEFLQQLASGLVALAAVPDDTGAAASTDLAQWWAADGSMLSAAVPAPARLRVDLPPDLPRVAVNAQNLTRAVLNLFTNAVEAARDARVTLWARHDPAEPPGWLALGVTDTGPGMDATVRRRAAEPFFTTKKRGFSTGLGLSLVEAIARGAGGSLRVTSEPGEGTTVALLIPIAVDPPARASRPRRPRRVAITLADPRVAGFMTVWLAARGYDPVHIPPGDPVTADLWITEYSSTTTEKLSAYRAARPDGIVLACGNLHPQWPRDRVIHVNDPADIAALAAALERAHAAPTEPVL